MKAKTIFHYTIGACCLGLLIACHMSPGTTPSVPSGQIDHAFAPNRENANATFNIQKADPDKDKNPDANGNGWAKGHEKEVTDENGNFLGYESDLNQHDIDKAEPWKMEFDPGTKISTELATQLVLESLVEGGFGTNVEVTELKQGLFKEFKDIDPETKGMSFVPDDMPIMVAYCSGNFAISVGGESQSASDVESNYSLAAIAVPVPSDEATSPPPSSDVAQYTRAKIYLRASDGLPFSRAFFE